MMRWTYEITVQRHSVPSLSSRTRGAARHTSPATPRPIAPISEWAAAWGNATGCKAGTPTAAIRSGSALASCG